MGLSSSIITGSITGQSGLSAWAGFAILIAFFVWAIRAARVEDRRRVRAQQPHTSKDTLLLLFSGLVIAAICLALPFLGITGASFADLVLILVLACGLTYLFNHKRKRRLHHDPQATHQTSEKVKLP